MRKFLGKWKGLWLLLTVIFTLIFVFAVVVGALLEANSAQVDRYLHTTSWTVSSGVSEDDVYTAYTPKYENSDALKQEHIDIGTRVGAEGSVLLQNENNALPLDKSEKITLFGIASTLTEGFYGMSMGGTVNDSQNVCLYDALTDRGAQVNKDMSDYYEEEAGNVPKTSNVLSTSSSTIEAGGWYTPYEVEDVDASLVGDYSDVGIVVIGRESNEAGDYFPGSIGVNSSYYEARNILALTYYEKEMIKVANDTCDKVIVLLNSCNAMELGDLMPGGDSEVDAVMWIGFPGNYGYYGVADVLLGESPSGHLTDTYAMNSTSAPAMQNFGVYQFANAEDINSLEEISEGDKINKYGRYYLVEAESIYTGYKYYETRYEDAAMGDEAAASTAGTFDSADGWTYGEEVAYSFGYGMSYTTFDQTITSVDWSDDMRTATVNVTVENTGSEAGRSVVQVYGQSPYTDYDKANGVEKASVQLLNYGKTGVIEAGKTADISIDIDMQLLASYDTDGEGTYIMEAGEDYYFALGCNSDCEGSHAAVNNILAAKGYTKSNTDNVMDSNGDTDAAYKFTWNESDTNLFSVSKEGVEVTNQLEDADLNYWDCGTTVTYLSRSDWEWKDSSGESLWETRNWTSSRIKGYTDVEATDEMILKLRNDTYEIDQSGTGVDEILFDQDNGLAFADMYSLEKDEEGNVTGVAVVPYDDEQWDLLMDELNLEEAITFICQGNRIYSSLNGSINFVGGTYTENGPTGIVNTIPSTYEAPWYNEDDPNKSYSWNDIGAAPLQAATFDQELMEEIGEMWGNDSLFINLPVLWAPSINTHRTQYNGRSAEYYSEDGVLSGYCAGNVGTGAQKFGLIVSIKHFAFNDQESNRCGVAAFMTEQQARENELRGFQIALEGDVKAIMTSYNRLGCTYSGANEGLMKGILRGEWNYKGYAVSDNASTSDYMTFTEAVLCGTTNFDVTTMNWGSASELANKYVNDANMLQAIKDSVHSTLWTFANSNMANYMTSDASQVWVANWWRVTYITLEVVFGVLALAAVAFYVVGEVIGKDEDDEDKQKEGQR